MSVVEMQSPLRLARDVGNLLQALAAVRWKRIYMPSIFGHYTVNSACNLRCSYCYVGQPEIFPQGFSNPGLPLERAKAVLARLREECLFLRLQGGEPTIYKGINELARYAKEDLRYWHTSLITNGLRLARDPDDFHLLFRNLDAVTISFDQTRLEQYPKEMAVVLNFLPTLVERCRRSKVVLTCNYTARWEELESPERIDRLLKDLRPYFASIYIMPVRQAGKTPLGLLKNALALNRKYSISSWAGFEYPEREEAQWYRDHCDPKLKIKIDADGSLVYPCENHSYAAGSLETHSIREIWSRQKIPYPNESCMGCGKQRFRSHGLKDIGESLRIAARLVRQDTRMSPSTSRTSLSNFKSGELVQLGVPRGIEAEPVAIVLRSAPAGRDG